MKCFLPAILLFGLAALAVGYAQEGKDDQALIQGAWKVESSKDSGKDDSGAKGLVLELKDGKIMAKKDGKVVEGTYKLDSGKKPKWIDVNLEGTTTMGIYELKGNTLKICHGNPGDKRATAFASEVESPNRVLTILKREKP